MNIDNVEINNSITLGAQYHSSQRLGAHEWNLEDPSSFDRFWAEETRKQYYFLLSIISIYSLSSAKSLLKNLRNEKDSELRNEIVKKLIMQLLADIIKSLFFYMLFGSKAMLKHMAKQLKEICKDIDEMVKEGLIELDSGTEKALNLLKGFANHFDDENEATNLNQNLIIPQPTSAEQKIKTVATTHVILSKPASA